MTYTKKKDSLRLNDSKELSLLTSKNALYYGFSY